MLITGNITGIIVIIAVKHNPIKDIRKSSSIATTVTANSEYKNHNSPSGLTPSIISNILLMSYGLFAYALSKILNGAYNHPTTTYGIKSRLALTHIMVNFELYLDHILSLDIIKPAKKKNNGM